MIGKAIGSVSKFQVLNVSANAYFSPIPPEQISELNIFAFSKLAMILSEYPEFFKCFKKIQLTYLVNLIFLIRKD